MSRHRHVGLVTRIGLAAAGVAMFAAATSVTAQMPGSEERPMLPLASSWNCREGDGFSPQWQWEQIKDGRHMLFTFRFNTHQSEATAEWRQTYQPIFEGLRERGEPICFRWGNMLDVVKDRSPFADVEVWRSGGESLFEPYQQQLALIQQWYPDPPYVIMLSNNEGSAPNWKKATEDPRYTSKFGQGQSDDEKKQAVADGYIERYNAMFDGMRAGAGPWGEKMLFIGYAWGGQANINMNSRLESPLAWDGVSARNYRARRLTDYNAYSTAVTAMNLRLKKAWFDAIKDHYFFEISTWWDKYSDVEPDRYGSLVTWALWVAKPHGVRHFVGWGAKRDDNWPHYSELVDAVDQIHENPTLRTFWQQGQPVINPHTTINVHVIDASLGEGTREQGNLQGFVTEEQLLEFDRRRHHFYALSTNLDPVKPAPASDRPQDRTEYENDAEFAVWAQAQVMGEAPTRSWLIFAYAPRGDEADVQVTIPDAQVVTMDVPQKGVFVVVEEGRGIVQTIPTLDTVP